MDHPNNGVHPSERNSCSNVPRLAVSSTLSADAAEFASGAVLDRGDLPAGNILRVAPDGGQSRVDYLRDRSGGDRRLK